MTSVEKVLAILEERHIPVSRLERELKFGNGYIRQLRKGSLPERRLSKIANYLDVPVEDLLSDPEIIEGSFTKSLDDGIKKRPPRNEEQNDSILKFALWGGNAPEMDEEDIAAVRQYAEFIRERKQKP